MSSSYELLCYTREATGREEANNEDIAYSMHLALRADGATEWEPLNENYGVFFAAGVPIQAASAESRRACVAAAHFVADPFDEARPATDAVAYGAVMPGIDITLKSLKDPYLFRLADGRFALAATRTARGGAPDGSERSAFLLALSDDLTAFAQLGLVMLRTGGGVNRPSVAFDADASRYVISWISDDGDARSASVVDIVAAAESGEPIDVVEAAVSAKSCHSGNLSCDCNIPNAVPGNVIAVTEEEASKLIERFGRIYNVETSVATQHIDMAASREAAREAVQALAKVRADLVYSDGSGATRVVDWNKDELEAIAQDAAEGKLQPGDTRTVSGRIRQTVYPVPFAVERADPSVFAWNFNGKPMFMFIATDDTDGNCVDPNDGATHMPLRIADSIEALSDAAGGRAKEIDLLKCGDYNAEGRAMTGCFWAPELHVIDGKLSVLFMPCFDGPATNPDGTPNDRAGKPDMWTGSCHIMQLKQHSDGTDFDPREPENWTVPKPILTPTGGVLNPIQRISLDMTVISDSGRWYYAWQQVGSIWIASFDPARPERLTCEPKQAVVPEFAWDNMIAEGPNAIVHDGTIYLIYSGSLVGIDYTTGLVTAPAGQDADLTDPNVWTKLDYPLQKSGVYNGQWQLGTGHGMWSNDEDGNLIYVFHNAEYENGRYGGRDAQVRRVHWSKEGMPILDMQAAEELNPDYADITMKIVVSGNKG
ncbi:family 43 glycosylhydrolase [uncultured Bifidobacterium sp.]|uniref:family 43 glycosylhydrolase n=1 Tax=uncultured Bifidobacterium sp. TaxID=165187 RepID=UPI0025DEA5B5|nr:family 43 glycosylhydrolase [uncultured Bifidobacterium sp.]